MSINNKSRQRVRINCDWCLSRGSRSLSAVRQNASRTNKRALPPRGNAEKQQKSSDIWRGGGTLPLFAPFPPFVASRRDAALWNFCGTAFFNWCNSNQPSASAPGELVKLFVAFRALSSHANSKFRLFPRRRSFVLITEKHSPRALLGRIKLPRNCSPSSGIMPSSLSE